MRAARRGLVLGAGGVLGAAWSVGALCALEEHWDWRAADCALVQGTSAGSVLAALLGVGLDAAALRDHQRGLPLPAGPALDWDHDTGTGGARPPRPAPRPGSWPLVASGLRHPGRARPLVTMAGLAPRGRGSLAALHTAIGTLAPAGAWAPRPGVRIAALDYRTGRRVLFGTTGAPTVALADAVTAACSIPGWYAPVRLGGRDYIDAGPQSSTSTDLLVGAALDEVVVLAPTASFELDRPRTAAARLERRWRRHVTANLRREVCRLQRAGTAVTVLAPGPADLSAMGANPMDPARRRAVLETALQTTPQVLARLGAPRR